MAATSIWELSTTVYDHVLSFLSSKQAVGAVALLSRWPDALTGDHNIFVEEPEGAVSAYSDDHRRNSHEDDQPKELDMLLSVGATMTAVIVALDHRPDGRPRFKGSTLKVVGNYKGDDADEWAIVGGTGEFGFAQGVGTFKVTKVMHGGKLREFNFRVRCPSSQKPWVPTPIKLGPFGGKGGKAFDITDQPQRLESVTIRSGNVIDSIAFSYTDQAGKKQAAGPWGGNGGLEKTLTFAPTETLKKVLVTTGKSGGNVVVTSLSFVTNVKTYPTFGKGIGDFPFSIPDKDDADADANIVGFFARAGSFVDAIGAYVAN